MKKQNPYQWQRWMDRGIHYHYDPKKGYPLKYNSLHMEDTRPDLRTVY